jgi:hypothetical protein
VDPVDDGSDYQLELVVAVRRSVERVSGVGKRVESVKVVQARLGHASASETLDTYSHIWPDSEDLTRAAIDSAWRAGADSSRTESGH